MDRLIRVYLCGMLVLSVLGPASIGLLLVKESWAGGLGLVISIIEIFWMLVSVLLFLYALLKPQKESRSAALALYYIIYSGSLMVILFIGAIGGVDTKDLNSPVTQASYASYVLFYITVAVFSFYLLRGREDYREKKKALKQGRKKVSMFAAR
jgi:hypothetical protein